MIEIDGVKEWLEQPVTEAGDYISDTYTKAIDLSTSPDTLSEREARSLARSVRRLNLNLATTSLYLWRTDAAEPYNRVVEQLNEINQAVPDLDDLLPLMDRESGFEGESPWFRFDDRPLVR